MTTNKLLAFLSAVEGVEESILATKVPVLSMGTSGEILSVALVAETEISVFLQALQSLKTPASPTAAPAPSAA